MNIFDSQFDLLQRDDKTRTDLFTTDCKMEWPFFSWQGPENIQTALHQLNHHCSNKKLIFNGINKENNSGTFLYQLTQKDKPILWCGIWLTLRKEKIQYIKFIFDTFECFKNENTVELFGFEKKLDKLMDTPVSVDQNNEVIAITNALQEFFLKKYNIPLQDTPRATTRLHEAARRAKSELTTKNQANIILPFFSANKLGPIQFYATIIKRNHSYDIF